VRLANGEASVIGKLNAFFELFVVLAFGLGWLVLEYVGRRLDKKRDAEKRRQLRENQSDET
jgi:hypothetical protein